jgi:hypothetical protein
LSKRLETVVLERQHAPSAVWTMRDLAYRTAYDLALTDTLARMYGNESKQRG